MANPNVPKIFSQHRRAECNARAARMTEAGDATLWLIEEISSDISERLDFMRLRPKSCLAIGLGAVCLQIHDCKLEARSAIDEEAPISGGPFDLIASFNRLGTVNDLPGAMIHMRNALAEDGIAIASLVGAGSLPSLRQIMLAADGDRPAARIHPQIDNRSGSALLERAGFRRHVVDSVQLKVSYGSFERMITDLRQQALTNVLADPPPPISKAGLSRAMAEFDRLRDDEGRVTEIYEVLTLTGWA